MPFIDHTPVWEPADLPINAQGDTKPGFVCTHQLENGAGQCGGNVFAIEDAIGDHGCMVSATDRVREVIMPGAFANQVGKVVPVRSNIGGPMIGHAEVTDDNGSIRMTIDKGVPGYEEAVAGFEKGAYSIGFRPPASLRKALKSALNLHSAENVSNTPDHILADFLVACLGAYDQAMVARARWYGRIDEPGMGSIPYPPEPALWGIPPQAPPIEVVKMMDREDKLWSRNHSKPAWWSREGDQGQLWRWHDMIHPYGPFREV